MAGVALTELDYLCIQYVKKGKIPDNEGAKSWVQKAILGMRVQELETDGGILEMREQT